MRDANEETATARHARATTDRDGSCLPFDGLVAIDFWTYEGQVQQMQMINFMKNLAIMGGLLIVLGLGPGGLCLTRRKPSDA